MAIAKIPAAVLRAKLYEMVNAVDEMEGDPSFAYIAPDLWKALGYKGDEAVYYVPDVGGVTLVKVNIPPGLMYVGPGVACAIYSKD